MTHIPYRRRAGRSYVTVVRAGNGPVVAEAQLTGVVFDTVRHPQKTGELFMSALIDLQGDFDCRLLQSGHQFSC